MWWPLWYGTLGLSDTAHVESGELSCGTGSRRKLVPSPDESPVIKYLAPMPAVTPFATPETAILHVVPATAVTCTSLAPVIECVALTWCYF